MDDKLARIFSPQTIAVVGASKEEGKIGNTIMFNLKEAGFKGDIFPINPKEEEIFGYKAYPSIIKTPLDVDLAVIAVPAKVVPSVLETCAQKKIAGTVIISAGFGEAGSGDVSGLV
jgi:acyl-CoA synthetase (NDP forming)